MIPIKFDEDVEKGEELHDETGKPRGKKVDGRTPKRLIRSSREVMHFSKD